MPDRRTRHFGFAAAWLALAVLTLAVWSLPAGAANDIRSYAIVRDDATLLVRNTVIRLYGTYIPRSNRVCAFQISPVQCGTRAARALRLRIQGFVTCRPVQRLRDRSLAAICFVDAGSSLKPPIDLGGYLIEQGLAVAAPGAPFEYVTLERIARRRGIGIWGYFADSVR